MPIINLDEPELYPNLEFIGPGSDVSVLSDTVVLTPRHSEHTVFVNTINDDVRKNSVIDVSGVKYRVMWVRPKTIYEIKTCLLLRGPVSSNLPFATTEILRIYKHINQIDNDQISDSSIVYDAGGNSGMLLYLDYTKGIETDVRMYFTVRDIKQSGLNLSNSEYAVHIVTTPAGVTIPYNLMVSVTGKYMMPVNLSSPAKFLTVNFAFSGATPATGGTINVFANTDQVYFAV